MSDNARCGARPVDMESHGLLRHAWVARHPSDFTERASLGAKDEAATKGDRPSLVTHLLTAARPMNPALSF